MTQSTLADRIEQAGAEISRCGQYRYRLHRHWSGDNALPFVMLNPSTADASKDDPTIRRCIGFAKSRGFGGIIVTNLFAFRSKSPKDMKGAPDPVGEDNIKWLHETMVRSRSAGVPVVAAWGVHGSHIGMDKHVIGLSQMTGARLVSLGTTKAGHPRHPLYVRADQAFEEFPPAAAIRARGE